jgi:hypothetical protein
MLQLVRAQDYRRTYLGTCRDGDLFDRLRLGWLELLVCGHFGRVGRGGGRLAACYALPAVSVRDLADATDEGNRQ